MNFLAFPNFQFDFKTGALSSPLMLLKSGIGPVDILSVSGIKIIANVPGVGRTLYDHPALPMTFLPQNQAAFGHGNFGI